MLLACSLLGACTLLVSTDDLRSASDARDAAGASPSDAATDTTAVPDEAGEADAEASVPFCAQRSSTFCADFGGGAPETGWTRTDINRGALELAAEGPNAPVLRASLDDGTGDKAARLHRDLATTPSEIHVEMDILAAAGPAKLRELMKLEVPTSHETAALGYFSSGLEVQLFGDQIRVFVERFDAAGTHFGDPYVAGKPFPVGAWAHLEVDAVLSPSNGSLQVKIDGASAIAQTGIPTLTDEPEGARLIVGGFAFDLPTANVDLFDNVLLDAK